MDLDKPNLQKSTGIKSSCCQMHLKFLKNHLNDVKSKLSNKQSWKKDATIKSESETNTRYLICVCVCVWHDLMCLSVCVLAVTVTFPSDTWRVSLIRQKGSTVLISAVDWHLRAAN